MTASSVCNTTAAETWLDAVAWDEAGLVPVIAQSAATGAVLMLAYMDRAALRQTLATGFATYWSRSKARLWRKGESSGHSQKIRAVRLDCDGDTLLLEVEQRGAACHTGRETCFYRTYSDGQWQTMLAARDETANTGAKP